MGRVGRLVLVALVLLACVGCDQGTKSIARQYLASPGARSYLGGSVRFALTENLGAFLGLGSDLPTGIRYLVLVLITSGSLLVLLAFTVGNRDINWWQWFGLALIAGGGVANLVDRLLNNGAVIDFMQLGIGSLRTGVFNLADVAIVSGGMLVVIGSLTTENGSPDSVS